MTTALAYPTPRLDRFINQMDSRLAQLEAAQDARERFLLMYRTFKNELRRNLQLGRFVDVHWSEGICCRMAEMYFEADEAYQRDRASCPEPWTYCFDAAISGELNLLQDMLLGMNAHINYDLPICTFDTMRAFGDVSLEFPAMTDERRRGVTFDQLLRRRYHDFLLINQIAWESIELIQNTATERFSRLLGVATRVERLGPLRLSKAITTRVITDYRDRAWGHTLLLLTAEDSEQYDTVTQLISRFAMDAANLVAMVDFRPDNAARLLRRGNVLPDSANRSLPGQSGTVVRFLVGQLGERATARVAERALIEYGSSLQPVLARLIDSTTAGSPTGQARERLMTVIAAHPTSLAAEILQRQIDLATSTPVDTPLELLADLRIGGIQFNVDEARFRRVLDSSLRQARWLATCYAELGRAVRGPLLDEALRQRLVVQIRRILLTGAILHGDRKLVNDARAVSQWPDDDLRSRIARAIDGFAPGAGETVTQPFTSLDTSRPDIAEQRLVEMCFLTDPWLRACALYRAADMRLRDLMRVIQPSLTARQSLVQETALWASSQMFPPEELRVLVEPLLNRITDRAVRTYAERLLEGHTSEAGMYSTIEKVLLLKNVELFVDIPAEDLAEIAGVVQAGAFRKGHRLIKEGTRGEALFLLVKGTVDVVTGDGHHLASVTPFAVLGETSILLDERCSASCIAATAGHALRIKRADFERLLLDYPQTALGLLRVMTKRARAANSTGDPVASLVSGAVSIS